MTNYRRVYKALHNAGVIRTPTIIQRAYRICRKEKWSTIAQVARKIFKIREKKCQK